jgi:KaiC/GvpD/RAD55 family RecA-like ATPase
MSFIKAVRMDPDPTDRPIPAQVNGTTWAATGYATAALNAELANIAAATDGSRNDTLNRAAFNMAQLIAGGQIPADTVQDALVSAARAIGLGEREIAGTIRSGFAKGQNRARTATPATPTVPPLTVLGVAGPQAVEGPVDTTPRLIDWAVLWADEGRQEWLLEPLLPAGRLVSIYSAPGVGKSLLALQIAAAISHGTDILGTHTHQVPVLYLDYENVDLDVRDRLQDMELTPNDLQNLHYWSFPDLPPLDTPMGGMMLLTAAQEVKAGLVVIDTLSRCVQGEENEASTMLNLYRCTLMPLKAAGITVLRLDHTGKDESKGQRGTSAKSGDVDLVWRYTEIIPDQTYLLTNEKHRIRITEKRLNIHRTEGPTTHVVDTRTITAAKHDAILQALDDAGLPTNAGRDRARAVLTAAGIGCRNETLAAILRQRQGLPPLDLSEDQEQGQG